MLLKTGSHQDIYLHGSLSCAISTMAYTLPNQLGGKDSKTISRGEPRLMFREASVNDWYAVKSSVVYGDTSTTMWWLRNSSSRLRILLRLPSDPSSNPTKSSEAPKKVPLCNSTVCQACFYYCHVPHYNMCEIKDCSVAKGQSCEIDPWCALCVRRRL